MKRRFDGVEETRPLVLGERHAVLHDKDLTGIRERAGRGQQIVEAVNVSIDQDADIGLAPEVFEDFDPGEVLGTRDLERDDDGPAGVRRKSTSNALISKLAAGS